MSRIKINTILRIYIILLVFLVLSKATNAQSLPMYSQYIYNMGNINPAYAGNRGVPSLSAIWREQWVGLPGAPTTKSFSYDFATNSKKVGIGIQLFEDKYVNYIKRTGAALNYNMKVQISQQGVLSLGLKFGFYNDSKNLYGSYLGATGDMNDVVVTNNLNKVIPVAGAGIYYNNDKFYAGISVPDLVSFSSSQNYNADNTLYQVKQAHYFLTAGYSFDLNEELQLKPSMLLKAASGAPISMDINTNLWMRNIVGLGASYRTGESILGMAEIQISSQLRFGYAYDMPFQRPNSHEFFLRYEFGRLFPNSKTIKQY